MDARVLVTNGTVEGAKQGDLGALERLYGTCAPSVLGYLRGLGAPDPERVLGGVFLTVVGDLDEFNGGDAEFRTWLFAIAHREAAAPRRRSRTREDPRGGVQPALLAFNQLTRDQRAVLLLRVLGDQSIQDVAIILGKEVGAVTATQRRALNALQRNASIAAVS